MKDDIIALWQSDQSQSQFTDDMSVTARKTRFERKVRRRNLIEYAAGGLGILLFLLAAVLMAQKGVFSVAAALAAAAIGIAVVLWNLHRRASWMKPDAGQDCRTYLRSQLARQAKALRSVPAWYIGPLLPGVLGLYLAVTLEAIGKASFTDWLENLGVPFFGTLAFFGLVIWINLRAAKAVEAEIAKLD